MIDITIPEFMTVRELANLLRVNETTVRRWIGHGNLEALLLPGTGKHKTYRIPRSSIEQMINQSQSQTEGSYQP